LSRPFYLYKTRGKGAILQADIPAQGGVEYLVSHLCYVRKNNRRKMHSRSPVPYGNST
jgi:hypothetical protein